MHYNSGPKCLILPQFWCLVHIRSARFCCDGRLHLLLGALARLEVEPGLLLLLRLLVHLLEALLALEALLQLLLARPGLLIVRLLDLHPLQGTDPSHC